MVGDSIFDVLKEGGVVAKETIEATFAEKVTAGTANHGGPAYRQAGTAGIFESYRFTALNSIHLSIAKPLNSKK